MEKNKSEKPIMYQFVHVESYSRSTPKRASSINKKTGKASSAKASGHCVKYIVDEAIREVNSIPHVKNPLPPEYLFGEPLEALEAVCDEWASSLKDARGHAMRKDALCLAAGIVSAPKDITPEAWDAFQKDSVEWLKAKYGKSLRTVIAHHDESHPHLHFYAVPEPGQRFETIHQGRAAAALVKAEGGVKGLQNQAYKASMRDFQDEFYERVGIEHGFTRIGPAKRRLTREEWKLEQIQAAAAARAIEVAKASVEASAEQSSALIDDAKAKASALSATALKKADRIEREAEKRGFAQGIAATEDLPWWKRVRLFVGGVVQERDALKQELATVTGERDALASKNETLTEKVKRYFRAGKAATERVRELEPALDRALRDAQAGSLAVRQIEDLRDALDAERGRNQHLAALNEALQPKVQPTMHVPGDKKKKFEMPDFESPSV